MTSHNERKTQFVSDLVGGTTLDIYFVTSVSAIGYLLWCLLKRKTSVFDNNGDIKGIFSVATFVDVFLNSHNLLLATTVFANKIDKLILIDLVLVFFVFVLKGKPSQKTSSKRVAKINLKSLNFNDFLTPKTYITVYRAQMMVITCICIMAVDFKIFPRRFGKVETWGTSLMDLGVGSFVFSMGLINSRSYLRQKFNNDYSYLNTVFKTIKSCTPIVVLGLIRLISVRSVDYHEHVTEYGKHWNFFFTLAFLPIINSLLLPVVIMLSPLLISISISISYEYLLVNKGLIEYIITSDRDGFLNANREGIFSLFGYYSIFLNGFALGAVILPLIPLPKAPFKVGIQKEDLLKYAIKNKNRLTEIPTNKMLKLAILFQFIYYIVDTCYLYSVSRRFANLLYVIWVSAYNCTFLYGFSMIDKMMFGKITLEYVTDVSDESEDKFAEQKTDVSCVSDEQYVPKLLSAVNKNSLVLFLVANLMTGLINLTFNTLDASNNESLVLLYAYELILTLFVLGLNYKGIVIR